MTDFLPKDYKGIPESGGNYMKFTDEENVFRVLGSAKVGWEYWTEEDGKNKPHRVKEHDQIPLGEVVQNKYGNLNISYFWAFPVWNQVTNQVQLLEVTQKTVLRGMQQYIKNPKWGDPKDYDFVVNRDKEGDRIIYTVSVNPKEKLSSKALEQAKNVTVDMDAWMRGEDPFKTENNEIDVDEVEAAIMAEDSAEDIADDVLF